MDSSKWTFGKKPPLRKEHAHASMHRIHPSDSDYRERSYSNRTGIKTVHVVQTVQR